MGYDELRAAGYDDRHERAFAQAPAAVDALARMLERAGGGRALELGVGTGRLALPLAARGIEVWGIDDSQPMVDRLRTKPGGAELAVRMGSFEFPDEVVQGPFALVFLAYNSLFELTTQDAQLRCLTGVARLLSPTGLFALEALAPDLTRLEQSMAVSHIDTGRVVVQATRHDPATQVVTGTDVELTEGGPRLSPWTIRYASVAEIDLMARIAGLALVERTGGWNGGPFGATTPTHVSVYGRAGA